MIYILSFSFIEFSKVNLCLNDKKGSLRSTKKDLKTQTIAPESLPRSHLSSEGSNRLEHQDQTAHLVLKKTSKLSKTTKESLSKQGLVKEPE